MELKISLACRTLNGFPRSLSGKESTCQCGRRGSLGRKDPLEKEVAADSSTLAWEIPWTEAPGGPRSMRMQGV